MRLANREVAGNTACYSVEARTNYLSMTRKSGTIIGKYCPTLSSSICAVQFKDIILESHRLGKQK